jgi:hypothetical protein
MKRLLAAAFSPERPLLLHVAGIWLLACAVALVANWQQIPVLDVADPDDHLRLVQVRDWLAGQSWWDVSQTRINPPEGGTMHWSRLIDVPIGGSILFFSLLFGRETAEAVTMALIPLLTLAAVMAVVALSARKLLDREAALLAAALVVGNPFLVHQLAPLRIDHHGWQILMAGLCLWALLREERFASGVIAGAALAFWAHVSAEALPHIALVGALLALRYVIDPDERSRFAGYLLGAAGGSLILFGATQPASRWTTTYCDAISWIHLLPMAMMGSLAGLMGVGSLTRRPAARAGLVGAVSVGAGTLFVLGGSACLAGPFSNLDPLVRTYWYSHVMEGLPIWRQVDPSVFGMIWSPIFGGIGTWLGWRSATDAAARRRWATLALMLAGSTLVGIVLIRALGVANLYSMPGCAFLLLSLLRRVRPIPKVMVRLPLTAAVILVATPTFALMGSQRMNPAEAGATSTEGPRCATKAGLASLGGLPSARVLAPLDIGPALLVFTPHSTMATGHHRNDKIMSEVISLWLGNEVNARRFVARRDVAFVVYCRGLPEVELYEADSPRGFVAQLEGGHVPAWLEPVETPGSKNLRVYRVKL